MIPCVGSREWELGVCTDHHFILPIKSVPNNFGGSYWLYFYGMLNHDKLWSDAP
jgi:hypothetical protein